jgi:hypothetical protein
MHKSGALQVSNLFINVVDGIIKVQKSVLAIGTAYASGLEHLGRMVGSGSERLAKTAKPGERRRLLPWKARSTVEVAGRHGQMRSGSKAA